MVGSTDAEAIIKEVLLAAMLVLEYAVLRKSMELHITVLKLLPVLEGALSPLFSAGGAGLPTPPLPAVHSMVQLIARYRWVRQTSLFGSVL